jgi:phosphoserine phosphatase RsbU/P
MKGLRIRTALLLVSVALLVAVPAFMTGQHLIGGIRHELGTALVRDHARLTQQQVLAVVGQELALSERFAESWVLTEWLKNEDNPQTQHRFFWEGERYRKAFASQTYFVAHQASQHFYYADEKTEKTARYVYTIREDKPENAWYFTTLKQTDGHWINIDFDKTLGLTNVWINVAIRDEEGKPLGVSGTGLNLGAFVQDLLAKPEPGITTQIIDRNGVIVAHPDPAQMVFDLAAVQGQTDKTLYSQLSPHDQDAVRNALAHLETSAQVPTLALTLNGTPHLIALGPIPSLGWTVVASLDMDQGRLLTTPHLTAMLALAGFLLLVLLAASTVGVDALVLRPLARLTDSVRRIGEGDYALRLKSKRQDELGELTRAFDGMTQQIHAHSTHLEQLVAKRTAELGKTHEELSASIRYAGLIQNAILPDHALEQHLADAYFVLWQPRDVVGGDFYLFRTGDQGLLLGVIDCAGHGVPGACMTMMAHTALEVALGNTPWSDPAAILAQLDQLMRQMLLGGGRVGTLATSMEVGLCHLNPDKTMLTFSGARIPLLWSDGEQVGVLKAHTRAIHERRIGEYTNQTVHITASTVFYLATDGIPDQAGGTKGHGFGLNRLQEWAKSHAQLPLVAQKAALVNTLEAYRGEYPQRDDMTLLAFRVNRTSPPPHGGFNAPF